MSDMYLLLTVESGKVMPPLVYMSNESLKTNFLSMIDTYKLDEASRFRYVNLEREIEVTAWNVRRSELSSASL